MTKQIVHTSRLQYVTILVLFSSQYTTDYSHNITLYSFNSPHSILRTRDKAAAAGADAQVFIVVSHGITLRAFIMMWLVRDYFRNTKYS